MNLKKILKIIKLHEAQISVILGVVILLGAGLFVIRYVKELRNDYTLATNATPTTSASPIGQILPEAAATNSLITTDSYTVVKGDSLWKIALRAYGNGYKWMDIAKANKLHNPNRIHVGNVLLLHR
jgi:nucleoid-associated protein YgaU